MARRAQQDTQYWADHVARQQASGLSVREYCQRQNLQAHHFYYWRKRSLASATVAPERAAVLMQPTRQAKATSPHTTAASTATNLAAQGQSVVIRLGDQATVHVPATMLETIEAVLKMTLRISAPDGEPSGQGFRSIIVRS